MTSLQFETTKETNKRKDSLTKSLLLVSSPKPLAFASNICSYIPKSAPLLLKKHHRPADGLTRSCICTFCTSNDLHLILHWPFHACNMYFPCKEGYMGSDIIQPELFLSDTVWVCYTCLRNWAGQEPPLDAHHPWMPEIR